MKYERISKKYYFEVAEKYGLTAREKEMGYLKLNGFTNKRIAQIYGISVLTVKKHFTHIYEKTWVPGRNEFKDLFRKKEM